MSEESKAVTLLRREAASVCPGTLLIAEAVIDELAMEKDRNLSLVRITIGDMKELIAAAVEHDDPKRVLREFIKARPELFGERKP